jgi:hypothetical protein
MSQEKTADQALDLQALTGRHTETLLTYNQRTPKP